jgi:uncharacterized protein YjaZ
LRLSLQKLHTVRTTRPYLKYAAIFILALTATGSIGFKLFQDHVQTQTLIVEEQVQKQVQSKIQEATFMIESPMPSVTLTVKKKNYPTILLPVHSETRKMQKKSSPTFWPTASKPVGLRQTATVCSRYFTAVLPPKPA